MIDNLYDFNKTIHNVAQRILEYAAEHTQSGSRYVGYDIVSDLISFEDYLQFGSFIESELAGREEVLEVEFRDDEFDLNIGLNWCPNYQWCDGDEEIFGMGFDEWERTFKAQPVSNPLDYNRLAEIGEKAIAYVMETSDMAIEDLTESLGMSMAELKQMGIYDPDPVEELDNPEFKFQVFNEDGLHSEHETIEAALDVYKELGDSQLKFVSVLIPDGMKYSGVLSVLECQDGKDALCNANTSLKAVSLLHEFFEGTPVAEAFSAAKGYLEHNNPILFYVYQEDVSVPSHAVPFVSFEAALETYRSSSDPDRSLGFRVFNDQQWGTGGILLQPSQRDPFVHRVQVLTDRSLENPHVALAYAKSVLSVYPNDQKAWDMRDEAEAKLGITDRVVDISNDLLVGKWRIHYVPPGGHYGSHNHLVNDEKRAFVQFYDMSQDKETFPNGQFTGGSYYASTLLESTDYPQGLMLDFNIPSWTVTREEMAAVLDHVRAQEEIFNPRKPFIEKLYEAENRTSHPFVPDGPGRNEPGR